MTSLAEVVWEVGWAVAGLLMTGTFYYIAWSWERLKSLEASLKRQEEECHALYKAIAEHPDYAEIRRRAYEIKHEVEKPSYL